MEIKNWLEQNNIKFSFENENDFTIDGVGLFHYIGETDENIFDEHFCFVIDTEYECDYLVYKFGGNYFYIKQGETEDVKLKMLKYIGSVNKKTEIDYVNLGIRGSYELLNGSGLYADYCKKAKFLNHKFLGISERNTLAGTITFQTACKEAEIKPIFGITVNLALTAQIYRDVKFYAISEKGWRSILRMNACINVFNETQCLTFEQLEQYSTDVICVVGVDFDFSFLNKFIKLFGDNLYCSFDVCEFKSDRKEIEHLEQIKRYFDAGTKIIKPVLICDTFYIDKDYAHVKKMLNTVGNIQFQFESDSQHYKTADEIFAFTRLFSQKKYETIFKNAIKNTQVIADKCCEFSIDTQSMKLPKYIFKEGEEQYKDSTELFMAMIYKGFDKLIKNKVENEQVYLDMIKTEVDVIAAGGFIDYFLVLWDIIYYCDQNNILTGVGRGSAGGSLVAYLLGITHLDPIKYNLLFERFLNEGRFDAVPDIDCDFEGLKRDDVKRYMENRFGIHQVASIGSYTTIKVKSGLKDIGRAMGYDHSEINIITSFLGDDMEGTGDDITQLFKAAQINSTLKSFVKENVELVNTVMILLKNHRAGSIHASGVLITPKTDAQGNQMEIYDWLPVKKMNGVLVTEWEGVYLDKCKFVKEDILGIAQLDKWSYTLKLIEEHTGRKINIHLDIPVDDDETYRMFSIGYNDDVFQFGSDMQKQYSIQVQPDNMEHLIAMNALYRPGPMESNAHVDFCKIKHGEKEPEIDIGMDDITGYTYGLWVYQEQLMLAYKMLTNCSAHETDAFRKMTAKFGHYRKLGMTVAEADKYYDNFINAYKRKFHVSKEYADSVWDKIIAFISYGFNRSHAVAYAITGYYCQYLKVHYPLQFWTTALHFSKEEELHKRISEIYRSGQNIELLPPDVNYSNHMFYADPATNKIYWSFQKVKYCGATSIDVILADREANGNYYSFEEFYKRVPKKNVNKRTITYMILAGCFDSIENIKSVEERLSLIYKLAEFSKSQVDEVYKTAVVRNDYWWLIQQKEVCGFGYIKYDKILRKNGFQGQYLNEIEFALPSAKGKKVMFAGIVIYINKKKTRKGEVFAELKCEVNSEIVFVTIWPDKYETYKPIINQSEKSIILISGEVEYNKYKNQNTLMSNEQTKISTFKI